MHACVRVRVRAQALQEETYVEPQPTWSAYRTMGYGYARMRVQGASLLTYEYLYNNGTALDSWSIAK